MATTTAGVAYDTGFTSITYTGGKLWGVTISTHTEGTWAIYYSTSLGSAWTTPIDELTWTVATTTPGTVLTSIAATGPWVVAVGTYNLWVSSNLGATWTFTPWSELLFVPSYETTTILLPPETRTVITRPVTETGHASISFAKGSLFMWTFKLGYKDPVKTTPKVTAVWRSGDYGSSWVAGELTTTFPNFNVTEMDSGVAAVGGTFVAAIFQTGTTAFALSTHITDNGTTWGALSSAPRGTAIVPLVPGDLVGLFFVDDVTVYISESKTGEVWTTRLHLTPVDLHTLTPKTKTKLRAARSQSGYLVLVTNVPTISRPKVIRQYPRDDEYVRATNRRPVGRNSSRSRQKSRRVGGRGTYM